MTLRNKRIFLIEDNIGNQTITKTLLESHGAVIAVHRTGQGVVDHLQKFLPVDLIIVDLMLPDGVTGYDIFSTIRTIPTFDGIPILAMSALDRSKIVPQAKKRGFAGFIGKPIKFHEFPNQINRILAGENIW